MINPLNVDWVRQNHLCDINAYGTSLPLYAVTLSNSKLPLMLFDFLANYEQYYAIGK